jgi:cell division protein FtsB
MGNKEEIKANSFEKVLMAKKASARDMTGAEDLLSAMGNEDIKSDTKKPHKTRWQRQQILVACCCLLAIAAAGIGFLYLDTKINAVQSSVGSAVKDLNTLKAQVTAADTREQLAAVTAEMEDLRATNTQLRDEVERLREAFETSKARKNNVVPAQRKR